MLLSICIFTYNQIQILRENISEIMKYPGDDIEIVVSDNCSTDPIKEMLSEFHDARIKYYRNDGNKFGGGIDGNILNGLSCCKGEYVFLFRTKDIIIAEKIDDVIKTIEAHPSAAYFLFSAKDERNRVRMKLENRVYPRGMDAGIAHNKLLIHPSGQIYKRADLRLNLYEKYINKHFSEPISNVVHQLIRMDLTKQGDFVTSSCMAWRYAYTEKAKAPSVFTTGNKMSIYAPHYQYMYYKCEIDFADSEFRGKEAENFLKALIKRYIRTVAVWFMSWNHDESLNAHYRTKPIPFCPYRELISFLRQSLVIIKVLKFENKSEIKRCLLCEAIEVGLKEIPKAYTTQLRDKRKKLRGRIVSD